MSAKLHRRAAEDALRVLNEHKAPGSPDAGEDLLDDVFEVEDGIAWSRLRRGQLLAESGGAETPEAEDWALCLHALRYLRQFLPDEPPLTELRLPDAEYGVDWAAGPNIRG